VNVRGHVDGGDRHGVETVPGDDVSVRQAIRARVAVIAFSLAASTVVAVALSVVLGTSG